MKSFLSPAEFTPSDLYRGNLDTTIKTARLRKWLAGTALFGSMLIGADAITGAAMWQNSTPEIITLANPNGDIASTEENQHAAMFVLSGFSVSNPRAEHIGEALNEAVSRAEKLAVIKNADNGVNIDRIVGAVEEYVEKNDIKTVDFYGHSMGGMVAMEVAAQLKKDDDMHIRSIILDCTPASERNVRGSDRGGTAFLEATDKLGIHLGPVSRVGIEAARLILKNHEAAINMHTYETAYQRRNNGSTKLLQDQATIVRTFQASDYKDVFPIEETAIVQLHPLDNNADHTVNDKEALKDWKKGLGRPVTDIALDGSGHASPEANPKLYNQALHTIQASYKLERPMADTKIIAANP